VRQKRCQRAVDFHDFASDATARPYSAIHCQLTLKDI